MATVYLSAGSNIGNRKAHLQQAVDSLKAEKKINHVVVSGLYQTEPVGPIAQDDFLNIAVRLETDLAPTALLAILHQIEVVGQRERIIHWGPRTIDLDIIWFGTDVIKTSELQVPHAEMANRLFVLEPLLEIVAEPRRQEVQGLIRATTDIKHVERIGDFWG
ncbi:2-amino-4-hydroxy-6-hydroxymethyldihydropteridine diphosphokinase [Weissella confusa]|uniref:2-amino-4-hydroxy-6- hydroxymethyldihydropteridine diphosphokinase n=1 Tax=Weissella confusa TaxID=1583 RepID=UPI0035A3C991